MQKYLKLPIFIFALIVIGLTVVGALRWSETLPPADQQAMFSTPLMLTNILILVAAVAMVAGVLITIFQNIKAGMVAIVGLVVLVILFGIGFATAGEMPDYANGLISESGFKLVKGGMFTLTILIGLALLLIVVDFVRGIVQGV